MIIRQSNEQDEDAIRAVHRAAFEPDEGPAVSRLAIDLLHDDTAVPRLSLVAEVEGSIVGHVIFSGVTIEGPERQPTASILAPLAVAPGHQRQRVGQSLVEAGLDQLHRLGIELVLVYGDPRYYSRTGFAPVDIRTIMPPFELEYPEAWMVLELETGALEGTSGLLRCTTSLNVPELW